MNVDDYFCSKCRKNIPQGNKLLHDLRCTATPVQHTTENNIDDLWYCEKCDSFMDKSMRYDHEVSHQYEDVHTPSIQSVESPVSDDYSPRLANVPNQRQDMIENISQNNSNGFRTVTRTIHHPGGGVTISQMTYSGGNGNNQNLISQSNMMPFFPNIFQPGPMFPNRMNVPRSINLEDLLNFLNQSPDNPVNEEILRELPEFKIEDPTKIPQEKRDCVICMNQYVAGDNVTIIPCTHIFHKDCITTWFKSNNTCPICKHVIDESILNHQ